MEIRHLLLPVAVAAGIAALSPAPCYADKIKESEFTRGNWQIAAYDHQNGQFDYCLASSTYLSGDTLFFGIYRNFAFTLSIFNKDWALNEGDRYSVRLLIDDLEPIDAEAVAINILQVAIDFQDPAPVYRALSQGKALKVLTEGATLHYDLVDAYDAILDVGACVRHYLKIEATASRPNPTNPFVKPKPDTPDDGKPSYDLIPKEEIITLISNIYGRAGSRFQFVPTADVPIEIDKESVAWLTPNHVGVGQGYRFHDKVAIESFAPSIIADDSFACEGKYTSGIVPNQETGDGIATRRIFSACLHETPEDDWVVEYALIVLDRSYYKLAFLFLETERSPEDSEIVTALLEQARLLISEQAAAAGAANR